MSVEESCAERFTEGTGGYLVCVEETYRHDATMDVVEYVCGTVALVVTMIVMYKILKG